MRRPTLALALGALFGSSCVLALDLEGAYRAALAEDPYIKASRAAADSGRERLPQARAALLPYAAFSAGRNQNWLATTAPSLTGDPTTTHDRYRSGNQTLQIRQPLYRPQQWAGYRQAKFNVAETDANFDRDLQTLAVRVGEAYFQALQARDQLTLIGAQKRAVQAQLLAAKRGLEAGTGTRTDVDEAQARLDLSVAQELEIQQNVGFTSRQLENLTGLPATELATLDVNVLPLSQPEPPQLDYWIARAEERSPELQALVARREAAKLEISKAQAGHYPTLDAVAQISDSTSENITRIAYEYRQRSIGVQLNVPIYAGGYVSSQVRQAMAELERTDQTLEGTKRDIAVRVHKEFRGITEGVARVKALEQAVRSATTAVDSNIKSHKAGTRTILDTLNAEQQLSVARRDLLSAQYQFVLSKLRLSALAGDANEDSVRQFNSWLKPST